MRPIELFHIGPQKSGTTWIYYCVREHPEVASPPSDSIHYFDIHYPRSREWLSNHFKDAKQNQKLFDPTYSYIRSPLAPKRIRDENANARIALSMRHPITRAFSHYWHEKKKCRHDFLFQDVLKNYDLFANWVETGFYAVHIERYLDYFPRDQILPQLHETMASDPAKFLRELFSFYGVNPDFLPSIVGQRVNVAEPQKHWRTRNARIASSSTARQALTKVGLNRSIPYLKAAFQGVRGGRYTQGRKAGRMEYLTDESPAFLEDLMALCIPEIERLEKLLNIDLSAWRSLDCVR